MLATPVPAAEGSSATAGMNPPKLIEMAASKNGRVSGKNWKTEKTAKARSYISPSVKTPFAARQEAQKKKDAMKALEKEMKEEKEAEAERKRNNIRERRAKQAEKIRLEEVKAKMSAKKAQRMKKRLGRTKKVNG